MDVMQPVRPGDDLDLLAERYAARVDEACDDEAARRLRDEFVASLLPFAVRLARRYRGRGGELADLQQVAGLGLVNAVDRYDPKRGSFTAFAVLTIVGELRRYFRDHTWGLHVPRRMQELVAQVQVAGADLGGELGRPPTDAEVARRCEVGEDEIAEARRSAEAYRPSSLNRPVGGDGGHEIGDLLGSSDAAIDKVPDLLSVGRLVRHLPPRINRILVMRFYEERTQADIAAELGVSQMHVSRLLARALEWMRQALLSDVVPRWPGGDADPLDDRLTVAEKATAADTVTVRVTGEVDRDNALRLRELVVRSVERMPAHGTVLCDLSGAPLCGAAGIRALLDAADAARVRGVLLEVGGLRPAVRGIAEMSGLAMRR